VLPLAFPATGGEPGSSSSLVVMAGTAAFLFGLGILWIAVHRNTRGSEVRVRTENDERE
jgi:hypothetical protein